MRQAAFRPAIFCVDSERNGELHFEALQAEYGVGDPLGHDEGLTLFEDVLDAAYGKFALAVQNGHHGVAAGGMGRDLLALIKGKDGHADFFVLHQRLAYNLSGAVIHQIGQAKPGFFCNVLIHILNSSGILYSFRGEIAREIQKEGQEFAKALRDRHRSVRWLAFAVLSEVGGAVVSV